MPTDESTVAHWPVRLLELCDELQGYRDDRSRSRSLGEVWLLLNASISRYLRIHTTRLGMVSREDLEDIASQKSLEILRRIDTGTWELSEKIPSKVTGFLSRVARNGLVDLLREQGRRVEPADETRSEWDVAEEGSRGQVSMMDPPDNLAERREYAAALRTCAEHLNPRWQLIWFFRVFAGMSSKEIASHPEVRLKSSHVDVLLQRSRNTVRDCMSQKGHDPSEMPPGTFVELWKVFRLGESQLPEMQG